MEFAFSCDVLNFKENKVSNEKKKENEKEKEKAKERVVEAAFFF